MNYDFNGGVLAIENNKLVIKVPAKGDLSYLCKGEPQVVRHYSKKLDKYRLLWQYEGDISNLRVTDHFSMPSGNLEIRKIGQEGTSIPDISTFWVALWQGEPVSIECRDSMWNSERYTYSNWVSRLKEKYSIEELA